MMAIGAVGVWSAQTSPGLPLLLPLWSTTAAEDYHFRIQRNCTFIKQINRQRKLEIVNCITKRVCWFDGGVD